MAAPKKAGKVEKLVRRVVLGKDRGLSDAELRKLIAEQGGAA